MDTVQSEPRFTHASQIGELLITEVWERGARMTNDQAMLFIRLQAWEESENHGTDSDELMQRLLTSPDMKMGFSRAEAAGDLHKRITPAALAWLILLCEGRPGSISLMVAVVSACTKRTDGHVTIPYLATEVFPFTVPSEDNFSVVWAMQKDGGDNYVDKLPHH